MFSGGFGVQFIFLVHPGLQVPGGDLVLLNDVHHGAPTGGGVPVEGVHHGLGDAVEQLLRLHLGLPEGLGHPHELLLAGPASHEVRGLSDATWGRSLR